MFILGIVFVGLGGLTLWAVGKNKVKRKGISCFLGSYFLLFGGLMCFFSYQKNNEANFYLLAGSLALMMIGLGIVSIIRIFVCTQEIQATYIGQVSYYSRSGVRFYQLCFKYRVGKATYEGQSIETYRLKYIQKHYQTGRSYPLYVHPKKPDLFLVHRRIQWVDVIMIVSGLIFLGAMRLS